ncbi:FadR/GntR family transcriptional regulator [Algibacillus agarilyticus]|uniref:FadR/GntR family transcriptional regulator n=1 Tax=Algibacillus agarilyticus TaxID=2234133 RepID=UPI000DD0D2C5|nr:FadR/GntR family transcriptional regulator [Algibacillus agarilyticus]
MIDYTFEKVTTERLYVQVAQQLTNQIQQGLYKFGERLPSERELAERLNVGRPTIREAMIALDIAQIVEIRTGSGIYVSVDNTHLSADFTDTGVGLFDVLEMRYIIEAESSAIAATKITDAQILELESIINEMEMYEHDAERSELADKQFHLKIAEICQNNALYKLINWLWDLRISSQLSSAYLRRIRTEGVVPSIEEHKALVKALKARDPLLARETMKQHIENATDNASLNFEH